MWAKILTHDKCAITITYRSGACLSCHVSSVGAARWSHVDIRRHVRMRMVRWCLATIVTRSDVVSLLTAEVSTGVCVQQASSPAAQQDLLRHLTDPPCTCLSQLSPAHPCSAPACPAQLCSGAPKIYFPVFKVHIHNNKNSCSGWLECP